MPATASRISQQAEYKAELDKLNSIMDEMKDIEQNSLPEKEREVERLKRASMEEQDVTWQDVEQARKEWDQLRYKLEYLEGHAREQRKAVGAAKQKARKAVNQTARERKLEALKKSIEGYEMVMAAHEEYQAVNKEQLRALELAPGERHSGRASIADIGQRVPHPFREGVNDIWYKQVKEYLKNVK